MSQTLFTVSFAIIKWEFNKFNLDEICFEHHKIFVRGSGVHLLSNRGVMTIRTCISMFSSFTAAVRRSVSIFVGSNFSNLVTEVSF